MAEPQMMHVMKERMAVRMRSMEFASWAEYLATGSGGLASTLGLRGVGLPLPRNVLGVPSR
jgi:hypothetical protein